MPHGAASFAYSGEKCGLVPIEAANAGLTLYQELRVRTRLSVKPIVPKGDKQTRMFTETPAIEAERVYIPKAAPWLADFQHEIVRFQTGKYEDQVDSLSQFLYRARMRELQKQQPKCHWTPFYR